MNLAPIVLFCYNRPIHTKRTIEALKNNKLAEESELFIFIDGAKAEDKYENEAVKKVLADINGFKKVTIFEKEINEGVDKSVISGVNKIINKYGKVIVVEDDIITSCEFLRFMNEALDFYKNNDKIMSIGGYNMVKVFPEDYNKDVYICPRSCSWGWATRKDRWNSIEWSVKKYEKIRKNRNKLEKLNQCGEDFTEMLDMQLSGELNAWDVYFCFNQYINDKYTIIPRKSLTNNIGLDGTGVHCGNKDTFKVCISEEFKWEFTDKLTVNDEITNEMRKLFSPISYKELYKDYKNKYDFANKWIEVLLNFKLLSYTIQKMFSNKSIIIYGFGTIGRSLYTQLINEDIVKVSCIIDENYELRKKNKNIMSLEEYSKMQSSEDIIIVSPYYYYDSICKTIQRYSKNEVISLERLINCTLNL